ncbi:MAG: hypothetical protein KBD56_05275 [Candidatus Eisenbacteria bacterium]|nr:hypothetical protein [Candidatus Eisenbacteria bacterium]
MLALLLFGAFALASVFSPSRACTIGVASGAATADGRPLLWKTRDLEEHVSNAVVYDSSSALPYLAVVNSAERETGWMGVNQAGFAIVNSYTYPAYDRKADLGNGELITRALGSCADLDEFVALLDSTNATGRSTLGNFGVIDRRGAAAMFEVWPDGYARYDPSPENAGFVVRTNFSFATGGSQGRERYDRSVQLISAMVAERGLDVRGILRGQMRDFSDASARGFAIPYDGRERAAWPHGFIDCGQSICRSSSVSAVVIHGVMPDEPAALTTMWTLLGNPIAACAVPYWPVGPAPAVAHVGTRAPLWLEAARLRAAMIHESGSTTLADSYQLLDGSGGGYWTALFETEDAILQAGESALASWRGEAREAQGPGAGAASVTGTPDPARLPAWNASDMLALEERLAMQAYDFLHGVQIERAPVAAWTLDRSEGCAPLDLAFQDASLHGPNRWEWDFDADGIVDSRERDPHWTFPQAGRYSVRLTARNSWGESVREERDLVLASDLPSAPAECRASRDRPAAVIVTWRDDNEDASGFVIFRDGARFALADSHATSFEDARVKPGDEHEYRVAARNACGESAPSEAALGLRPAALVVQGSAPHRESVTLRYALPSGRRFTLDILDATGRRVVRLAEGFGSGEGVEIVWDGRDARRRSAPSGIYWLALEAGPSSAIARVALVR